MNRIPEDTILIVPDPSQPDGTHRLRVGSWRGRKNGVDVYTCESLVTGRWVVMNGYGQFANDQKEWSVLTP